MAMVLLVGSGFVGFLVVWVASPVFFVVLVVRFVFLLVFVVLAVLVVRGFSLSACFSGVLLLPK